MEPEHNSASLADVLAACPGRWVAVDRRTSTAIAVAETPYLLVQIIHEKGLRDLAVVRAPDPSEPELVGLG